MPAPKVAELDDTVRSTLQRVHGSGGYNHPGHVGIELEAEGTLQQINTTYWKTEVDGSLRNGGLEFILKKPVDIGDLPLVLDQFAQYAKSMSFNKSIRTSCHVHMNAQPMTFRQCYAVIGAYWLFEDILVEICGTDRIGNLFCLRASDSQAMVDMVIHSLRSTLSSWSGNFLLDFHQDTSKYSALNLSAMQKFGSIEFRSMRGIYTRAEIEEWVMLLWSLVSQARKDGSPQKVYQIFKDASPVDLVDHYFKEYSGVIRRVSGWKDMIKKSSMFLAQLSYIANKADKGEFKRPEWKEPVPLRSKYSTVTLNVGGTNTNWDFDTVVTATGAAQAATPAWTPFAGPQGFSKVLSDSEVPLNVDGELTPNFPSIWTKAQELFNGDH